MSTETNHETRIAALETAVCEHQEILRRLLAVPMICMALGAEVTIRSTLAPATPEHRPGGSVDKPHPMSEALRRGDKLAAIAQRDRQ